MQEKNDALKSAKTTKQQLRQLKEGEDRVPAAIVKKSKRARLYPPIPARTPAGNRIPPEKRLASNTRLYRNSSMPPYERAGLIRLIKETLNEHPMRLGGQTPDTIIAVLEQQMNRFMAPDILEALQTTKKKELTPQQITKLWIAYNKQYPLAASSYFRVNLATE